jgi:hypothetical protein
MRRSSEDLISKCPPTTPPTWKNSTEIILHSIKGAGRSFWIGFLLRGGVNFLIRFISVLKRKMTIVEAIRLSFSTDSLRFATMISSFSFLWKLVSNGLFYWTKEHSKRNCAIAGGIAGLSVLIETPANRLTIAQQFFMRAMQAGKNALKQRDLFSFTHGDTLLFSVAAASIMYAYTMYPDTIPKEYYNWIIVHGRVPKALVEMNRENTLLRKTWDITNSLKILDQHNPPTLQNRTKFIEYFGKFNGQLPQIPCSALHAKSNSCVGYCSSVFWKTYLDMIPVYGALNIIPLVVLRTRQFLEQYKTLN